MRSVKNMVCWVKGWQARNGIVGRFTTGQVGVSYGTTSQARRFRECFVTASRDQLRRDKESQFMAG